MEYRFYFILILYFKHKGMSSTKITKQQRFLPMFNLVKEDICNIRATIWYGVACP